MIVGATVLVKGACKSRTAEHSTHIGNSVDERISYSDIVYLWRYNTGDPVEPSFLDFAGL